MPRYQSSRDGDRIRVLFVQTKRQPSLDADTWIHLEIVDKVDRSRVEVHAACATGPSRRRTPTYRRLREISDVDIVPIDLGRERADGSMAAKMVATLSLVPAAGSLLRLAWYVHRHRIDLVYTSDRPRDAAACALLRRITRAKCIVHCHVAFDPNWMRGVLQRAIRDADALIAISDFVASTLRAGGCDPSSIHVVRNGIDLSRWEPGEGRERVRRELVINESTPVVLSVCRLFRSKGVTELVQALRDISGDVPDAVLLVAGDEMEPGYLDELHQMVRAYGLDGRVRFLGRRDDVPALMAAADVFAMPSHYEPFGLVYAEAMAMALPVVALDSGGTVEVVEDGVTGLLSPVHDRAMLAANLRTLLLDRDTRLAYGASGRRRVQQLFTTQRMADDTAAVFAEVLGRPRQRAGPLVT